MVSTKELFDWYDMAKEDWSFKYIPHGVTPLFKPLRLQTNQLINIKTSINLMTMIL